MTAFKDVLHRLMTLRTHREVRRLATSVGILDFAIASISLFEPIYLYTLGFKLQYILAYYFCIYLAYFLLLPIGGRIARNLGLHHVILYSSPFLVAYYLSLMAIKTHPGFMVLAAIIYPFQKILYWPGYHSEMSRFGLDGQRGRELGAISAIAALSSMFGPLFGGIIIARFGFPAIFGIASVLILLSNIPLLSLPEAKSGGDFKYFDAFRRMFDKEHRRDIIPFIGYGDELLALVVWPIFIYLALRGFTATGALVSVSLFASALVVLYIGRLSDLQSRHAVLRTGVVFTSAAWLTRLFIRTPLGLLGSDMFYNVSRSMAGIPMLSILYSRAGQADTVREVVFFEMSLALGKMLCAALGIACLLVFPDRFEGLFVLGAVFALLYSRTR